MTLDIQPGKLCAIVGVVGSGKSTLLQVILGELELDEGSLIVNGSISYAPQEPWLFEGTIRQNILFISDYNEKRYRQFIFPVSDDKCSTSGLQIQRSVESVCIRT